MKLIVKNMVCDRCKMFVTEELSKLGLKVASIKLGEVDIQEELTSSELFQVKRQLQKGGLDIIETRKQMIVENIKHVVINEVHNTDGIDDVNFTKIISDKVHYNYNYLNSIFKKATGMCISKYITINKIERAKELIRYSDLTISEIAIRLDFSNIGHLSNKFKEYTGYSPTDYRKYNLEERKQIEYL